MSESPVAIVTGGAQGIGAAICVELLKAGYKVCVSDIQEEKGKLFAKDNQEKYGTGNVIFIASDVTKEEDYKEIFEFTLKEFKRIDVVVNNAGVLSEQTPKRTIAINLMGPIIGCQLAIEYMGKSKGGKGGMVINTASILGFITHPSMPIYTASKHGIIGLTRSYGLPYHLEKEGILFAAICPTFTLTEMMTGSVNTLIDPAFDPYTDNRVMSTEHVAKGVLKLLKDRINGSTLLITNSGYKYIGLQEDFKDMPIL